MNNHSRSRKDGDQIAERARQLYRQSIRAAVEPAMSGKFIVIDVETGEYEVDSDEMAALDRAYAKHPDPSLFLMRIGSPVAHRIGRRVTAER